DLVLRERVRLLTVTGAGGVGKTRLVLRAASTMVDAFADGVRFVDLAPLTDASAVMPALAQALGVRESAGEPLAQTLARDVAPREQLVVVDNVEHVLDGAPVIADLLEAAPRVQVVATSRMPLHLSAERRYAVAGLPEHDALELFRARARALGADPGGASAA